MNFSKKVKYYLKLSLTTAVDKRSEDLETELQNLI